VRFKGGMDRVVEWLRPQRCDVEGCSSGGGFLPPARLCTKDDYHAVVPATHQLRPAFGSGRDSCWIQDDEEITVGDRLLLTPLPGQGPGCDGRSFESRWEPDKVRDSGCVDYGTTVIGASRRAR